MAPFRAALRENDVVKHVVTIEFVGLYLVGTEYVSLSPLSASIGAFLVTDLGNLAWLSVRRRT